MPLTPEAGRVLGCLVEKQLATPQQYPLTLNALVAAAGQATSRDPVVDLDDDAVLAAVDELRAARLVRVVLPSHGRSVNRYRHVMDEVWGLDATRSGVLALLLLRGPQTAGELRARLTRLVGDVPGDLGDDLAALSAHADGLVELLGRRPGQKEDRWRQTVAAPWGSDAPRADGPAARADDGSADTADGLEDLRAEVASLRVEVAALRSGLDDLRAGLGG